MKEKLWLGLDVGGTKILGAIVSDGLKIRAVKRTKTLRDMGPDSVLDRTKELAEQLLKKVGPVQGIGVGFAGLADYKTGVISSSIMLPGWQNYPLGAKLSMGLNNTPVFVDNDATVAGYGEYLALGAPKDMNMVLLTVGTGIGGAIIIKGELYRGSTGVSAEFGNMTVDLHGKKCWCGNRGCLNMLASGSAISKRAADLKSVSDPIPVEILNKEAESGDKKAALALEEGAMAMGAGLANIINIFNPDRIVLTGGVSVLGGKWLETVKKEASNRAFNESANHVKIALSQLGTEVGAFGAAGLARDNFKEK